MAHTRALHVERVAKRFQAGFVLEGVSLELCFGRAFALVGPNGAGKSTLLRMLAAVDAPTRGTIHLDGTHTIAEHRAYVGFLAHELGVYDELSGREQLAFAAQLRGTSVGLETVKLLELSAFYDRPLGSCSRGQRQRVALAQALIGGTSVILLDEPTTGLDEKTCRGLGDLLRARVEQGALVVVSTHDRVFAQEIGADFIDMEAFRPSRATQKKP